MHTGVSYAARDFDADRFHPVARELGVASFGLDLLVLAPGRRGRIHAHERQEDVYAVLEGKLTFAFAGEHEGRDGIAYESWDQAERRRPRELPLPADVPVDA